MPWTPEQKRAARRNGKHDSERSTWTPLVILKWKWLGSPGSLTVFATPALVQLLGLGGATPVGAGPSQTTHRGCGGGPNADLDPNAEDFV